MISKEEEEGVETITFLGTLEEITEIQKEYEDYSYARKCFLSREYKTALGFLGV